MPDNNDRDAKGLLKAAKDEIEELGGWEAFRSGDWLLRLIQRAFRTYYQRATIEDLRQKYGSRDRDFIEAKLVKLACRMSALLGGVTGAAVSADEIVGIVTAGEGGIGITANIAVGGLAIMAEAVSLVRLQLKLVANLARLYEVPLDPDDPEDLLTILAFALGGSVAEFAGKVTTKAGAHLSKEAVKKVISTKNHLFALPVVALLVSRSLRCAVPAAAQSFTEAVWAPYTDRFHLIHSEKVKAPANDPSTNNGLLYTAEACVIMQLSNVSYNRDNIAAALKASQVKPGLFRHSPTNLTDTETPDDYIGLGTLAGVCGFRDVARDILNYGTGADQASGPTILASNIVHFAHFRKRLSQCKTVPYNYNNVSPGKFSLATWMGRFPAMITHWKIAAGDRPSPDELGVWGAALLYSGTHANLNQDHWLQSWLMVLTYQMSPYHSAGADFAVGEWWKLLHARYPNGIKQTMTDYLGAGAQGNPLSEYIDPVVFTA